MLQWYIRVLADLSVNVKTYQPSISGAVARDELNNPIPSDCVKKCQQAFLAPLPRDGTMCKDFTKDIKPGNISKR